MKSPSGEGLVEEIISGLENYFFELSEGMFAIFNFG